MFVLLFAFVFGGAIVLPGYPDPSAFREYLMPGIFAQTIVFAAATTAIGMTDDINKGIIDRFRSLPMARSAVLTLRQLRSPAGLRPQSPRMWQRDAGISYKASSSRGSTASVSAKGARVFGMQSELAGEILEGKAAVGRQQSDCSTEQFGLFGRAKIRIGSILRPASATHFHHRPTVGGIRDEAQIARPPK